MLKGANISNSKIIDPQLQFSVKNCVHFTRRLGKIWVKSTWLREAKAIERP